MLLCLSPPQASPSKGYTVFHWLASKVRGHLTRRSEENYITKNPTRKIGRKQNLKIPPARFPLSTEQLRCAQLRHPLPKLEKMLI